MSERAERRSHAALRLLALSSAVVALAACGKGPPQLVSDGGQSPGDAGGVVVDAMPDAGVDAGPPDLTVYEPRSTIDFAIEERTFDADACELTPDEDCIGSPEVIDGPFQRRLLRFSIETPNVGFGDITIGSPSGSNDDFVYSPCHDHYHFLGYAEYRLIDGEGMEVADGQKQAFCLVDTHRFDYDDPTVSPGARYSCTDQGIQRGWSDVYDSALPCQFIDVTDVDPGQYTLVVEVNAEGRIEELDTSNNVAHIPVDLDYDPGSSPLLTPTEDCPEGAPGHATRTLNRECGWTEASSLACTPGEMVRVGCGCSEIFGCGCGGGSSCSGDPILRVCDAARSDGNCSYAAAIASSNNACFSTCPRTDAFACPESGQVAVHTGPRVPGEPYECDLGIEAL